MPTHRLALKFTQGCLASRRSRSKSNIITYLISEIQGIYIVSCIHINPNVEMNNPYTYIVVFIQCLA